MTDYSKLNTLVTTDEIGPFGECNVEIRYFYTEDDAGEPRIGIHDGQFYYNGQWIDLDKEAASNVRVLELDDLCVEDAQKSMGDIA
jgi:hypothetical protein